MRIAKPYTLLVIVFLVLASNSSSAHQAGNEAKIAGVSMEYFFTSSYEEAKDRGQRMTLQQLTELKSKLIELMDTESPERTEETIILQQTPLLLLNGLYQKDKQNINEILSEVKNNLILYYQMRGTGKWDQKVMSDKILYNKFILYATLLCDALIISIKEKDYDFCAQIIRDHYANPFIDSRRIITKHLIDLYNKEDIISTMKDELGEVFNALIAIENKILEDNIDQEDFIRSRSGSKSLLKVLKARKDEADGTIKVLPFH